MNCELKFVGKDGQMYHLVWDGYLGRYFVLRVR